MENFGGVLALLGFVAFFAGLIGLVAPKWLKQNSRGQVALRVLLPAFVVFGVGGSMLPSPDAVAAVDAEEVAAPPAIDEVAVVINEVVEPVDASVGVDVVEVKECGLKCLYEKNPGKIDRLCKKEIERYAKYDIEWTAGWADTALAPVSFSKTKPTDMILLGDKVKFQNGFGAWQPMTYACVYDTVAEAVIEAIVEEGRL